MCLRSAPACVFPVRYGNCRNCVQNSWCFTEWLGTNCSPLHGGWRLGWVFQNWWVQLCCDLHWAFLMNEEKKMHSNFDNFFIEMNCMFWITRQWLAVYHTVTRTVMLSQLHQPVGYFLVFILFTVCCGDTVSFEKTPNIFGSFSFLWHSMWPDTGLVLGATSL